MINNLNKLSAVETNQPLNGPRVAGKATKGAQGDDLSGVDANESKDFDSKLNDATSAANANGAVANAQANATAPAAQVNLSKAGLGLGTSAKVEGAAVKAEASNGPMLAQPKVLNAHMLDNAEVSPLTMKAASSANAGVSIAGLKPWNQDWVFEGKDRDNQEGASIRPLIGGVSAADEVAQAQNMLKLMGMAGQFAQVGNPANATAPGASQVSNLRSRGDDGQTKAADGDALLAVNAQLAAKLPQQLQGAPGAVGLEQAMAELNGQAMGLSTESGVKANTANQLGVVQGKASDSKSNSNLAGSEFLKTLALVKSGPNAIQNPQGANLQSGTDLGAEGNLIEARGERPELKLVDSLGGKSKKSLSEISGDDVNASALRSSLLSSGASLGNNQSSLNMQPTMQLTGHVVPGAGAQDQLSHDAVQGLSSGIKSFGENGGLGNGEMRIRLKPDGLGELHLKVMTHGDQVGLQIQASDENAKKILQDSMGSLKESLASQNLTLGKVELSIAHAFTGNDSQPQQHQQHSNQGQQHQQQMSQDMLGQNAGQQNRGSNQSGFWGGSQETNDGGLTASPFRGAAAQSRSAMAARDGSMNSRGSDGRIDVRA